MARYAYEPSGVCSRMIEFEITDNEIHSVRYTGGCNGNLQGLSRLIEGMDRDDAIKRLRGINCNGKGTSCPDQLALALIESKKSE